MCLAHDRTRKNMREWLSWWSTTLPRSGSRVRVPSRALFIHKKVSFQDTFFCINESCRTRTFEVFTPFRRQTLHWNGAAAIFFGIL